MHDQTNSRNVMDKSPRFLIFQDIAVHKVTRHDIYTEILSCTGNLMQQNN